VQVGEKPDEWTLGIVTPALFGEGPGAIRNPADSGGTPRTCTRRNSEIAHLNGAFWGTLSERDIRLHGRAWGGWPGAGPDDDRRRVRDTHKSGWRAMDLESQQQ